MTYSIQMIHADENSETPQTRSLTDRYATIEEAITAAETEIQIIGVPGVVTYRILDEAGQPVPIPEAL